MGAWALAVAAILLLPSLSQAQRYRGGDRGRYEGGGRGQGSRSWNGGWGGRSGIYLGYGAGYYGYGAGYYPSYGYSPLWNGGGYYSYPAYDFSYGYAPYSSSYNRQSFYNDQSAYRTDIRSSGTAQDQDSRVLTRVRVPDANAKVWVEGEDMNTVGLSRRFISPPLEGGYGYTYTFRAQWTENGKKMDQTRQVRVHAGDRITVDFTAPESGSGSLRRQNGLGRDEVPMPLNNDGNRERGGVIDRREREDRVRDKDSDIKRDRTPNASDRDRAPNGTDRDRKSNPTAKPDGTRTPPPPPPGSGTPGSNPD
jgi:uncharacterized protein (TIGR03000 family)